MAGDQPSGPEKPWVPPTQQWQAPPGPPPPPVPPASPPPAGQGGRNPWPLVAAALLVLLLAGAAVFAFGGGEDEAAAQTVRFQQPTEPGPDPFTRRADVRGEDRVRVGSGRTAGPARTSCAIATCSSARCGRGPTGCARGLACSGSSPPPVR